MDVYYIDGMRLIINMNLNIRLMKITDNISYSDIFYHTDHNQMIIPAQSELP